MEEIKIKLKSTEKEIFEPANYHVRILLYDTHLIMECLYEYTKYNDDLGMMGIEPIHVQESMMMPKTYNLTPIIDYSDQMRSYRLLIDSSVTNFTNPNFSTYEEAKVIFDKIVNWKFSK